MKQKKSAVHFRKSPADSALASLRHQTKKVLRKTVTSTKLHNPKFGERTSDELTPSEKASVREELVAGQLLKVMSNDLLGHL